MSVVAQYLGDNATFTRLQQYLSSGRAAFHSAFFVPQCGCYATAPQQGYDVLAIASGSVPPALLAGVLKHLVSQIAQDGYHLSTGIMSTSRLFEVLFDNGYGSVALRLLTQVDYPSYGYWFNNPIDNATALHELWNPFTTGAGMNSYNHHVSVRAL